MTSFIFFPAKLCMSSLVIAASRRHAASPSCHFSICLSSFFARATDSSGELLPATLGAAVGVEGEKQAVLAAAQLPFPPQPAAPLPCRVMGCRHSMDVISPRTLELEPPPKDAVGTLAGSPATHPPRANYRTTALLAWGAIARHSSSKNL